MTKITLTTALTAAGVAAFWMAPVAHAATSKNLDKTAYKIVLVEGDARQETTIESQQELTGICQGTCRLYIGSDPEPYDIASRDILEIELGGLYHSEDPTKSQGN